MVEFTAPFDSVRPEWAQDGEPTYRWCDPAMGHYGPGTPRPPRAVKLWNPQEHEGGSCSQNAEGCKRCQEQRDGEVQVPTAAAAQVQPSELGHENQQ